MNVELQKVLAVDLESVHKMQVEAFCGFVGKVPGF